MAELNEYKDEIASWMEVYRKFKELEAQEKEMRRNLAAKLNSETGTKSGLSGKLQWKVENGLNYNVNQAKLNQMIEDGDLTEEELDCIRWKGELKMKEYKALPDDDKFQLMECITITPAMPTITIVVKE